MNLKYSISSKIYIRVGGIRIWYLDSSWPTDPFDQLDVAQLSKIFTIMFLKVF